MKKNYKFILLLASFLLSVFAVKSQNCAEPNALLINSLTQTSADIAWTVSDQGSDAGVYKLKVSTTPIADNHQTGDVYDGDVSESFISLSTPVITSPLTPGTTYYVYIRNNCEAVNQGLSSWFSTQFTTPCNPVAVPVIENFNTFGALPLCWLGGGTSVPTTNSAFYAGTTGRSIRLNSSTYNDSYLISPPINLAADNLEVIFKVYGAAGADVKVGILTDAADVSQTIPVYESTILTANSWESHYAHTTSSYEPGTGAYVVFYLPAGRAQTVYIDDIEIREKPVCSRPINLSVSAINVNDATISWQETGAATAWTVRYVTGTDTSYVSAGTNPFVLPDLIYNTVYSVAVKSDCDSEYSFPVVFKTACGIVPIPYSENFNNYSQGISTGISAPNTYPNHTLPDCWEFSGLSATSSTYPQVFLSSTAGYNVSGNSLFFKSSSATPAFAVLPQFDVRTDSLRILFTYRNEGTTTSNGTLSLGVLTDPSDASTFVEVASYATTTTLTSIEHWFDADSVPQNSVIAFKYTGSVNNYYLSIDNVVVKRIPTCKIVTNVKLDNITRTSADLSWTPGENETAWELKLILGTDTTTVPVSGQPAYTIPNLTPNTQYNYKVLITSVCSVDDLSEVVESSFVFTTECNPLVDLPYTEGFESYTATSLPECWTLFANFPNTTNPRIYVNNSSSYVKSGTKSLYFVSSNTLPAYALLPGFTTPVNQLTVDFYYRNGGTTDSDGTLSLGLVSGNDTTTFVELASFPKTTGFSNIEYSFKDFVPAGGVDYRIAFKYFGTAGGYNLGLDSVTVKINPDCFKPLAVETGEVTDATAEIIITDTIATSWEIALGAIGFDPEAASPYITATNDTVVLPDLQAATPYQIYVRATCGGTVSGWRGPVAFTTLQTPATLPYNYSFEDTEENAKWTLLNETYANKWIFGTATAAVATGNKALYISDNHTTGSYAYTISSATSQVWAYRTFRFEEATYNISFNWKAYGEGNYDYLIAFLVPASELATSAPTSITYTETTTPEGWIRLGGNKLNLQSQWQTVGEELHITEAGYYKLAFYWRNDAGGGTQPPAAIDDLLVYKINCVKPYDFVVNTVTTDSVSVSWAAGESIKYQVVLSDTIAIDTTEVTAKTVSFNGLESNTAYSIKVRAICTIEGGLNDTTIWSDAFTFRTECSPIALPYTENFEEEDDSYINCWKINITDEEDGAYNFSTSTKFEGERSFYARGTMAVSPRLDIADLTTYQTSGYAYAAADSVEFVIGVMFDPSNVGTYTTVKSILLPVKNTWTEFKADFSVLAGSGFESAKYIVYYFSNATTYTYIDLLSIEETPSCLNPDDVRVSGILTDSVTVDWTPTDVETSWLVRITEAETEFVVIDSVVNTHPVTLGGFNGNTAYAVQVAAICTVGDTSKFTLPTAFRTACGVIALPYTENFNAYTGTTYTTPGVVPDCWTSSTTNTTYPAPHIIGSGSYWYSPDGTNSLGFTTGSAGTDAYAVLPSFDTDLTETVVSFWARWESTTGILILGYVTDPNDMNTFDTITVCSPAISGAGRMFEYPLNSYAIPENAQLAFKYYYPTSFYSLGIDNVSVRKISPCVKPVELVVDSVGINGARLIIRDTVATHTTWELAIGAAGFDPYTHSPLISTADTIVYIPDLDAQTQYDVYVRANCGDAVSHWTINVVKFTTECDIFASGWTETFDAESPTLGCWKLYRGLISSFPATPTDAGSNWGLSNYGLTGSNIKLNNFDTGRQDWAVSPAIDLGTEGDKQLSFDFALTAYSSSGPAAAPNLAGVDDRFIVLISVDGGETYDSLRIWDNAGSAYVYNSIPWTGAEHIIDLSAYTGEVKIAFYGESTVSNADNDLHIDNVIIDTIPSCAKPTNLLVSGITSTSADIAWTPANGTNAWNIIVSDTAVVDFDAWTPVSVSTNSSYPADNLTSETTYYVYIQTDCGGGDVSAWARTSFKTLCAPFEIPFVEDFSTWTTGAGVWNNPCWAKYRGDQAYNADYPYATTTTYSSTPNSLYFYNTSSTISAAFLPLLDANITGLKVEFDLYMSSAQRVDVVIAEDPQDISTWTTIQTISDGNSTNKHYVVYLNEYTGNGAYIGFKSHTGSYYSAYLDNVEVDYLPTCIPVANLTAQTLSYNEIAVDWDAGDEETSWNVIVSSTPITDFASAVPEVVDTNYYEAGNLTPHNTYYVYVQAGCGSDDLSEWVSTTVYIGYCIPGPTSVDGQGITNITFGQATVVNNPTGTETGNYGDYSSLVGDAHAGTQLNVDITYSTGYTYGTRIYVDWNNDLDFNDAGELVYTGESTSTNPTTLNASFLVPAGIPVGYYRMRIVGSDSGDNNSCYTGYWGAVEDYTLQVLEPLECYINAPTLVSVTENSATITWPGAAPGGFEVQLVTNSTSTTVSTNTAELPDLFPNTYYSVRVRAICGGGSTTDWSTSLVFKTVCGVTSIPYAEDFNSYSTDIATGTTAPASYPEHALPECWNVLNLSASTSTYPQAFLTSSTDYAVAGNALLFKSSSTTPVYAVLPRFDSSLENLNVRFTYRNGSVSASNGTLSLGVMSNPTDPASFVTIAAYPKTTTKTVVVQSLENAPDNATFIAFKYEGGSDNYYLGLDDIAVNCYDGVTTYQDTICAGFPYLNHGFNIAANELVPGLNTFTQEYIGLYGDCDRTSILELFVKNEALTEIYDTICSGLTYNGHDFLISVPESRTYRKVLTTNESCDSVVVLNLHVSLLETDLEATVCEVDGYVFGGQTLTTSGIYTHTTQNAAGCDSITTLNLTVLPINYVLNVNICEGNTYWFDGNNLSTSGTYTSNGTNYLGCDSIVTLNLTVIPTIVPFTQTVCAGGSYVFGGETLTASGVYRDTLANILACDSISELHLVVLDPIVTDLYAYTCNGAPYYGNGFNQGYTETGVYSRVEQAVNGCDSTIVLHLTNLETVYGAENKTICQGEVYIFNGNSYSVEGVYPETFTSSLGCDSVVTLTLTVLPTYATTDELTITTDQLPYLYADVYTIPAGTPAGQHEYIVTLTSTAGCDSIVTLNATIQPENGLSLLGVEQLKVYPNPLRIGESVQIDYDFTYEEKNNLVIEVFNTLGEHVYINRPVTYPITVSEFSVSGVYLIRITTGTNKQFQGRIIVKD